jgi:hypothetical protein
MTRSMKFACAAFVCAAAGVAFADPSPVILAPGLMVRPFAGLAAGFPSLAAPKFGLIDMPGGPFGGMMYISELGGREVSLILPTGVEMPFTVLAGPTPTNCLGIDIDGPIANLRMPTRGIFGGPAFMKISQAAPQAGAPAMILQTNPPGGWTPWLPVPANPGMAQLQFDRTPGFMHGGMLYYSDWGPDASDGIYRVNPAGGVAPYAPLPGLDPRYFTFDITGGMTGYGPGTLWVTSFNTGQILSIMPGGAVSPPLAVLAPGIEGLAFAPGDLWFGQCMYVANLNLGTIDIVMPQGQVKPFAIGFPGAAYPMFVTDGPYAKYNNVTLYVADGMDSVWVVYHCPADFNNDGILDFFDYLDFAAAFDAEAPAADMNADGQVDFFDYLDFVAIFDADCA